MRKSQVSELSTIMPRIHHASWCTWGHRAGPASWIKEQSRGRLKALSSCMSNLRCRRTRTLWHSGSTFRRSSDSGEPVSWSATSGSQRTPRCMLRPSLPQPRSPCYRTGIYPQAEPQLRSTTTVVGAKVPSGPRIHRPSVEIVIVVYGALVPVFTKYPSPSR